MCLPQGVDFFHTVALFKATRMLLLSGALIFFDIYFYLNFKCRNVRAISICMYVFNMLLRDSLPLSLSLCDCIHCECLFLLCLACVAYFVFKLTLPFSSVLFFCFFHLSYFTSLILRAAFNRCLSCIRFS